MTSPVLQFMQTMAPERALSVARHGRVGKGATQSLLGNLLHVRVNG